MIWLICRQDQDQGEGKRERRKKRSPKTPSYSSEKTLLSDMQDGTEDAPWLHDMMVERVIVLSSKSWLCRCVFIKNKTDKTTIAS